MSDAREPSYYEVALTNRQVLVAFILLLTSLVAVFFAGVWVGRDGGAALAAGDPTADADPTQIADRAAEPGEVEDLGDRPPEYNFFSDPEEATIPQEAAGGEGIAADVAAAAGGRQAGQSAPSPRPSSAGGEAAGTAAAEDRPEPGESLPPRARLPNRELVIQVVSSRDQEKAKEILRKLQDGGYPASLSTTEQGPLVMYRVRVGPYRRRAAAENVADELRRKFLLDTWITEG